MEEFEVYKNDILLADHNLGELQIIYDEHVKLVDFLADLFDMDDIDREIRFTLDEELRYLWGSRLLIKGNYYVSKKALFEKRYGEIILN